MTLIQEIPMAMVLIVVTLHFQGQGPNIVRIKQIMMVMVKEFLVIRMIDVRSRRWLDVGCSGITQDNCPEKSNPSQVISMVIGDECV